MHSPSQVGSPSTDNGPLLMAGMAAAGLGVAALLSSSLQLLSLGGGVARSINKLFGSVSSMFGFSRIAKLVLVKFQPCLVSQE